MSVTIRTRPAGRDPVARSHRRASVLRATFTLLSVLGVVGGGSWLMFDSSVFAVTDIVIDGAADPVAAELRQAVDAVLGQRRLGFLQPARNILLLSEDAVASSLRAGFPNVEQIEVLKMYPHTVRITAKERQPVGSWCVGERCQYFDATGARWGTAVPSRGPLLLLVQDDRPDPQWDQRLFTGLWTTVQRLPTMGLRPITVVFPDAAPGDMRISVSNGYEIVMDALGDLDDQISTLEILIADRAKDPAFKPSYIDIRTPGRAYYR